MTRFACSLAGLLSGPAALLAQNRPAPRLLVGIIMDQMRPDYLTRFADQYGPDGFNRPRREGLECRNTHYNYVPTATGPGHTSLYTGTTPRYPGRRAAWPDKTAKTNRLPAPTSS